MLQIKKTKINQDLVVVGYDRLSSNDRLRLDSILSAK